jgi:hypothetical protein
MAPSNPQNWAGDYGVLDDVGRRRKAKWPDLRCLPLWDLCGEPAVDVIRVLALPLVARHALGGHPTEVEAPDQPYSGGFPVGVGSDRLEPDALAPAPTPPTGGGGVATLCRASGARPHTQ